ncbi:ABC transporter permease [Euzebya tangerina]|uniref:ABC transporter permease n=1 Tax=Euzebya tangerina TaxID=591198 RepID=UPI0013C321F9|nr:ABC transporter permease [Euzebya tangerina]
MFIALREIRRSIGRFGLLTAAVVLLVLLLLFFQAVAGTLTLGFIGGLENSSSEVFVYDERAQLNPQASILPVDIVAEVGAIDGVEEATAVGLSSFASDGPSGDVDVTLVGAAPDSPATPRTISEGRQAEAAGEALFSGSSLTDGFALDDEVAIGSTAVTVVGVADDAPFNVAPTLYVPFETYAAAVQERAGAAIEVPASFIGVTVGQGEDAATVAERITSSVAGVEAVDRATAVAELPGAGQISQSFGILYLLLFIVVTIVTGVFFLILTVQKADALVLLRAVGAGKFDVVKPVLLQVLLVVGVGAVLGAGVATGLLAAARDTFGAQLDLSTTLTTVAAITVLGLLASIGAVRRVLAIDPIQATTSGGVR